MVYLDNMRASYGHMTMCHMIADSTEELLEMADRLGLDRKWLQDAGTAHEHFDVAQGKRRLALQHGAQEITQRELAARVIQRRRDS